MTLKLKLIPPSKCLCHASMFGIMKVTFACLIFSCLCFSKHRYEQKKKKREQQKKSAASRMDLKELKMGYNIDSHDYSVRLKAAKKFLNDGDKVKVIVNLKGREKQFRDIAIELLKKFQNDVGEMGTQESKDFRERNIYIVLVPNKTVLQKAQEPPKKKEKSTASEVSELTASEVSVGM